MNVEGLRKLKSKIEEKKRHELELMENKYYKINLDEMFSYINFCTYFCTESITINEIKASENTNEVVKNCGKFIKKLLLYFSENDIPYDQIKLIAQRSFYCKASFAKKIYEYYKNIYYQDISDCHDPFMLHRKLNDTESQEEFQKLLTELPNQICPTYFPIKFKVDWMGTGTEELSANYDNNFKHNHVLYDINNANIQGVIDIFKFAQKMSRLGYDVEISPMNQYNDNENKGNFICITADFGRKNAIQKSKGIKK